MVAIPKTSLSAGEIIRAILLENSGVAERTNKIFPVLVDAAELPYIVYRRIAFAPTAQKSGRPGADECQIEILCYASRYAESVELAEAVRQALDMRSGQFNDIQMRACFLSESAEDYQDDAFLQQLIFNVRI